MNADITQTLRVPGATLGYQVRGTGPLLLLIAGSSGGSEGFMQMADYLAAHYTLVTYDRRGAANSPLDDPAQLVTIATHADDAHLLLAALTDKPAYVFGSSAGALVALDLVARYPAEVQKVIAHEPPAHYLLPNDADVQFSPLELAQREGALAAFRNFGARTGVTYAQRGEGVSMPRAGLEAATKHAEAFFAYTYQAVQNYRLDFATLKASPVPIVLGGAAAGHDFFPYRLTQAVAAQLQMPIVDFPSHHAGYMAYPQEFAARLSEVLAG